MRNLLLETKSSATLPNFADESVRRRLGRSGLIAFRRIMDEWRIPADESRQLIAIAPETDLDRLDPNNLSEEKLMRISYLIGIYKVLHEVHGDLLADEWIRLPNANKLFKGLAPLVYMARGGLVAMQRVRRLLEGRAQGC